MKSTRINLEQTLFLLAFIFALSMRFINLGESPLTDAEAGWALQALQTTDPNGLRSQVSIGPQPGYIFLTGIAFELFGSSNFLARFWPAAAGSLLVLAAFLLRFYLGRKTSLIAAFGLALDPGLTIAARTADGTMMAVGFGVLGISLYLNKKPILAGILAGLALLSGPSIYLGIISLGFAVMMLFVSQKERRIKTEVENGLEAVEIDTKERASAPTKQLNHAVRLALISVGLTILIVGTSYLRFPQGLAAWTQSLADFLGGWMTPSGVSPFKLLTALLIYQPLGLTFGLIAIGGWLFGGAGFQSATRNYLLICIFWLVAAFTISLIYPGRQVSDLVWTLIPMWVIAGAALKSAFPETEMISHVSLMQAGLILTLAALFWITLVSTNNLTTSGNISPAGVRAALLAGILSLGVLTTILVALGWSLEISRDGFIWGIGAAAAIYLISVLWGATQLRAHQPSEIWSNPPGAGQEDLILDTLKNLSEKNTGMANDLEILATIDSPSLRWLLRRFPNTRFRSVLPNGEMPPVILTPVVDELPALASSYRGQDFVWKTWPDWEGILPDDIISWLTFRQAPIQPEKLILWARSDQFPGGSLGVIESETAAP